MRFSVPNTLIARGICEPLTFSKSSAGPAVRDDACSDLGDFKVRVDRGGYALELAVLLECGEQVPQVVKGHARQYPAPAGPPLALRSPRPNPRWVCRCAAYMPRIRPRLRLRRPHPSV